MKQPHANAISSPCEAVITSVNHGPHTAVYDIQLCLRKRLAAKCRGHGKCRGQGEMCTPMPRKAREKCTRMGSHRQRWSEVECPQAGSHTVPVHVEPSAQVSDYMKPRMQLACALCVLALPRRCRFVSKGQRFLLVHFRHTRLNTGQITVHAKSV